MKHIILLVTFFLSQVSFAQSSGYRAKLTPLETLAYDDGTRFRERRSFGIYPEIQFIKSPVIGVSASFAHLKDVEWSSFNRGVNLGFEFAPTQNFYGPKASIWGDVFAMFIGGNIGLSTMYYRQNNIGGLYLRPEIGLGIPRLHLKYGFGFRMAGDAIEGFQRHSLTLAYHFTLIERLVPY